MNVGMEPRIPRGVVTSYVIGREPPVGTPIRPGRLRTAARMCVGLLLLVSPAGSWITGQTLNADGVWVLRI